MTEAIKTYLKRNAPWFGTIGGVGGFCSDVLAPLANFSLYLLIASIVGIVVTLGFYLFFRRDQIVTKREEFLTRLIFFAAFTVIWGVFAFVHVVGPDKGVLASTVPGIEQLQSSLGIIEKDVAEIKQTTGEIKGDTEQILAELRSLKLDLAAAQSGSITAKPQTAGEWYTNAVLQATAGDERAAVASYQEFFAYGYPYLDVYQSFNTLAKSELSKKELLSFYTELASQQPNNVLAALMSGALIKNSDERRQAYDEVRAEFGDSSVLLYWLMNEYSVVGTYVYANELTADEKQQWSTSDQAELKALVRAYEDLPLTDSLEPYFVSAFAYDGAKSLINTFQNQFADDNVNAMLDNPLVLVTNPTGYGNQSALTFVIYDSYTDILYRIPGVVDEFTSTIPASTGSSSPWGSATPSPELSVTLDILPGKYEAEVYWLNANGKKSKTYKFADLEFLDLAAWSQLENPVVWQYPE